MAKIDRLTSGYVKINEGMSMKKKKNPTQPKKRLKIPQAYQKPLLRRVNLPIPKVGFARPDHEVVGDI